MPYTIRWDMSWVISHISNFSTAKDFWKSYIETHDWVSYKSFQRMLKHTEFCNPTASNRVFYDWDDAWLFDNWDLYDTIPNVYSAYVKRVGCSVNERSFDKHCERLHLHKDNSFTAEEDAWIVQNYPNYGYGAFQQFYKEFGRHTMQSVCGRAKRLGVSVPYDVMHKHQSDTKSAPLLSTTTDTRGTILIKADSHTWMPLSRYIWEQAYGAINANDKIIFLDGDKRNCELSNLVCVTSSQFSTLLRFHMLSEDACITKTAITWSKLYLLLKQYNLADECN